MAVRLDDWLAFNDEIAALTRAGVPLESGLLALADDLPGGVGSLARHVGEQLQAGETLESILAGEAKSFPPVYGAVIAAGMRSGKLSAALEQIAGAIRRGAELRRVLGVGLIYPCVLLALAYTILVFLLLKVLPVYSWAHHEFDVSGSQWLHWIAERLSPSAADWWVWPPVFAVVAVGVWWWHAGRAVRGGSAVGFGPLVGRMLRSGRLSIFADTLALLVEHRVPLPDALPLAAGASGDRALIAGSQAAAEQLGRGGALIGHVPAGFPALFAWLLAVSRDPKSLAQSLRRISSLHRDRATRLANWVGLYLPIIASTAVGVTAAVCLVGAVVAPWFQLLHRLALP